MKEEMERWPKPLRQATELLCNSQLDSACHLIAKAQAVDGRLKRNCRGCAPFFATEPGSTGWLIACYLDAHLYSASFDEWSLIAQRLIRQLESESWSELLLQLRSWQELASKLQAYWGGEAVDHLPAHLQQRAELLRPLLPASYPLRIPLHTPCYDPSETTSLIDPYSQMQRPSEEDWLCTSPLALALAIAGQQRVAQHLICAGLNLTPQELPLALFFPRRSHLKLTHKQELELLDAFDHLESAPQKLSRALENYSRRAAFEHYGPRLSLIYRFQHQDRDLLTYPPLESDPVHQQLWRLGKPLAAAPASNVGKKLPRVIHLCSELSGSYSPHSKLLYRLLSLADTSHFDLALVVTHPLLARENDYPMTLISDPSSLDGDTEWICFLEKQKIAYLIDTALPGDTLEICVERIAQRLEPIDADLLIFHGAEPIHHALAGRLTRGVKVLLDYGSPAQAPGFDALFCCLEDTPKVVRQQLTRFGSQVYTLPLPADARWNWQAELPSRTQLGLPEEVRVATTIFEQLEQELTPLFCHCVSAILRRCSTLIYAPIGPLPSRPLAERFDPDVRSRVIPLATSAKPAQLARVSDLYLNPIPFGSPSGIFDALANGCPVVTIYDRSGPPQSRYGGLFAGIDLAISSLNPEEYIERACQLYEDPLAYFRASQRAYQEYEWRANLWAYTARFEQLLSQLLNRR